MNLQNFMIFGHKLNKATSDTVAEFVF